MRAGAISTFVAIFRRFTGKINGIAPETDPNGIKTYMSAIPYMLLRLVGTDHRATGHFRRHSVIRPDEKAELAAQQGGVLRDALPAATSADTPAN